MNKSNRSDKQQARRDARQANKGNLRILLGFIGNAWVFFAVAALAVVLGILFNFMSPQVLRITADSVIGTEPFGVPQFLQDWLQRMGGRDFLRENLILCGAAVLVLSLLSGATTFVSRLGVAKTTETMVKRLRDGLFAHIQRLPYNWHIKNQTGDIIQRCTSDLEVIQRFVSNQLLEVIRISLMIVLAVSLMFQMNARLAAIAFAFIPVIVGYSGFFFSLIARNFKHADEAEGALSACAQENFTGVRVVRAFGREKYEIDRFDKLNSNWANLWIRLGNILSYYWAVGDVFSGLQILTIVVLGIVEAVNGSLTLGEFLVFVSYNSMLVWPIRGLGRILSEMSKTGVSLGRICEILKAEPERDIPGAITPPLNRDIEFKNVSFRYEEGSQPILRDVSFAVPAGSTIGILGGTGSGKSTLMHLLDRLYDITDGEGTIEIGGVDIRNIQLGYLRKNIGMVLQEPFLFSRSIRENISAPDPAAELERVRHAASIASVDDAITDFSHGYDTVIGERGVTLSGGQKQRVAIARMLMQNAPIMIFDDSLSAVDSETDAKIRAALKEKTSDATVILISHRITTIMHADKIIVMQDGSVADTGTHAELITREGVYKRIYEIQESVEAELAALEATGGEI